MCGETARYGTFIAQRGIAVAQCRIFIARRETVTAQCRIFIAQHGTVIAQGTGKLLNAERWLLNGKGRWLASILDFARRSCACERFFSQATSALYRWQMLNFNLRRL